MYLDALKQELLGQHLIEDHPCPPDIAFFSVAFLELSKIYLWSRIKRRPHLSSHEDTIGLPGKSEVTNLDVVVKPNQNVVRLEIPVHFAWIYVGLPLAFM